MAKWLLRCGLVLAALSPLLVGLPAALILWLLMPMAVECSREAGENYFMAAAIVVLIVVTCFTQPVEVYAPAMVWGGCGIGMAIWEQRNTLRRGATWAGICLAVLAMVCITLGDRYGGQAAEGLAGDIVRWIDRQRNAGEILWQCYQAGFAQLDKDQTPLMTLFGMLMITPEAMRQLEYSLQFNLTGLLRALIPQLVVLWLLLTTVLSAKLPDVIRRRKGLHGRLAPFGEWHLTDTLRGYMNLLVLGYVLQLFSDAPLVVMLGNLCGAAFQYGYMILGLACMEGTTKQFGTTRFLRRLWMLACILFAPVVLMILGIADGWFDFRKLRRLTDDEGGFEQ